MARTQGVHRASSNPRLTQRPSCVVFEIVIFVRSNPRRIMGVDRLPEAASTLSEPVSKAALIFRFQQGLPKDFHAHRIAWMGTYEDRVSKATQLGRSLRRTWERVAQLLEATVVGRTNRN